VAVTAIPLTTGSSTTNASSYTTASITPTPGRLVLAAVLATVGSGTTDVTLSGCGLNWVRVTQTTAAARTVHVFRAMGTPTAGQLTITGASPLTSALWQVTEFNGTDTTGTDGSGAIVQSVAARPGSSTVASVPFPGVVDGANAAYGAVGVAVQEAPVVGGSPWTALGSTTQSGPTSGLLAQFTPAALQDVAASWSTSSASFVVGVEIKAAATVGTPTGAASGSWGFSGAAAGTADYRGTASGTWSFTGAAVGGNAPVGRASGSWSFTGSAAGVSERSGTAAGSWGFTGAATGTIPKTGSASGTWGFTGSAVGRAPVVVATSHTYGFATLVSAAVGTAALATAPAGTATLVGSPVSTTSVGGFGRDFGLNFGVVTVTEKATFGAANGASEATLADTTGYAALQT
jgi:hypothetical protein